MEKIVQQLIEIVCPFCGVGCNLELEVKDSRVIDTKVKGRNPHVNGKYACVKGLCIHELINHPERLKKTLFKKKGVFKEIGWKRALEFVATRLKEIKGHYGPNAIGILCSGKILNEEAYLAQKFARTVIGTNNIDTCARLCHAASEIGLKRMLGYGAVSICWADFAEADTVMMIGENVRFSHPVLWNFLVVRKKKFNVIVADAGRISSLQAEVYLNPRPGTDLIWLCGVAKIIYEEGLYDQAFIQTRTIGFETFIKSLSWCTPAYVQENAGVAWEDLRKIARLIGQGQKTIFIWGMGLTQHPHGTKNVEALVNLALMTGNVGKVGAGVAPLRGQNNVQGAGDMGASPFFLPGHYAISEQAARFHFEGMWEAKIPMQPGLTATEMIHAVVQGRIKGLYIIGENPLLSEPQSDFVKWMLQSLEFLVVQDVFMTETAKLADVVLPAAMIGEKEGTVTNAARRIQLTKKAVDPPDEARADWEILTELARYMGRDWSYKKTEDIWNEVRTLVPLSAGASYKRLAPYGLIWPVYSEEEDTPRLYLQHFAFHDTRARFMPITPPEFVIAPTEEYPFLLVSCRLYEHFNTGEMSRRCKKLTKISSQPFVYLNEEDANSLGLKEGEEVRVSSPYGSLICPIKVGVKKIKISKGIVIVSNHFFNQRNFNRLISAYPLDPDSKTPPLKVVPVRLERV